MAPSARMRTKPGIPALSLKYSLRRVFLSMSTLRQEFLDVESFRGSGEKRGRFLEDRNLIRTRKRPGRIASGFRTLRAEHTATGKCAASPENLLSGKAPLVQQLHLLHCITPGRRAESADGTPESRQKKRQRAPPRHLPSEDPDSEPRFRPFSTANPRIRSHFFPAAKGFSGIKNCCFPQPRFLSIPFTACQNYELQTFVDNLTTARRSIFPVPAKRGFRVLSRLYQRTAEQIRHPFLCYTQYPDI